jgi:cell wall-associated NlpC family hydrolase
MPSATLRARLGVTAASLFAALGLALVPASTASARTTHHSPNTLGNTHLSSAQRDAQRHRQRRHRRHQHRRQHHRRAAHARVMHHHNRLVHKVLREARRQKGKPYSYGAAGPRAFDCSGLVRYVYGHSVHRWLPHNAAQQYHALHHIKRRHLRRGDLIFTDNGYISHVGIFAGHHHWWVAPHTGTRVHKQRIYHAHFVYARVLVIHHRH